MKLTIKQTIAFDYLEDNSTNDVLYGGAAGGGKSILGSYWILKNCLKYPDTRWLIGRSELKTLKETTLVSLFKVCEMQGLKNDIHYKFNQQSNSIHFTNKSVIILKDLFAYPSDPNFDNLGSLEITGAFIDECNQVSVKAKNIVRSRIRHNLDENNLIPKMLMTCNPAKNWVYTEFYFPFKEGTLPVNKKFVRALVTDNDKISKSYYQNLLGLDKASKERLLHGNFEYDDDPAVLCDFDAICDCFTNENLKPTGDKKISADLAMQGRDRFVSGSWDGDIVTVRIDKPIATGKQIESDLKNQMQKDGISHSQTVVDSDGLGAYLESYLTGIKEFHGGAKANDSLEYYNLKSECAYKLAEKINKRELKIICTPEQKERIVQEIGVLKAMNVDKDETRKRIISKEIMKELLGRSPDYLDMLLMGMYFKVTPRMTWAAF